MSGASDPGRDLPTSPADRPPRDRRATYAAVLVIEALTITALWAFGRYFSFS